MKILIIIFLGLISFKNMAQQITPMILFQDHNRVSTIEDRALNFYNTQIEENPNNVQAFVLRSDLNRSMGNFDEAERDMRMALSLNPFARLYTSNQVRKEAFPTKSYTYTKHENESQVNSFKKNYFLVDEYNAFLQMQEIDNVDVSQLQTALRATLDGNYDEAMVVMDNLQPKTRSGALYYDIRGIIELETGVLEKAVEFFTLSIKDNPYFVIPYYNRAVAYKRMGLLDKSEEDFYTAISLNAEIAKIHFSKGKLLEMKQDVVGASHYYQNALDIDESYAEAATNYSVLLKTSGEYSHAMSEIENAIKENPDNLNNYYVKGGLNFIYGEYTSAIDDFDTYLRMNSEDNDALFFRGLCKIINNDPIEGCIDLKESIRNGYDKSNVDMVFYFCKD